MIKDRNFLVDNIKLIAIFFVVLGHIIEPSIKTNTALKALFLFIYSFHMPLFAFLAGLFSSEHWNNASLRKNISTILVPFVLFTLLYEAYHIAVAGRVSDYTLSFQPHWILWFLFSLFCWKLALPFFLKSKFAIAIAIVLATMCFLVENIGYFLGVARTVYFFPFFILGHIIYRGEMWKNATNLPKWLAASVILIIAYLCWENAGNINHHWFFGSFSYHEFGMEIREAVAYKLLSYLATFILIFCILSMIPKREYSVTSLGQQSLFVYLWHGFAIKLFLGLGILALIGHQTPLVAILLSVITAIVITVLLSLNFVAGLTNKILLNPLQQFIKR